MLGDDRHSESAFNAAASGKPEGARTEPGPITSLPAHDGYLALVVMPMRSHRRAVASGKTRCRGG